MKSATLLRRAGWGRNQKVYGRKIGKSKRPVGCTTGATRHCRLAGCSGVRMVVKWENGRVTYPCVEGVAWRGDAWQIL